MVSNISEIKELAKQKLFVQAMRKIVDDINYFKNEYQQKYPHDDKPQQDDDRQVAY